MYILRVGTMHVLKIHRISNLILVFLNRNPAFPTFPIKNQVERRFKNLKILKIAKMRIDHIFGNAAAILLYTIKRVNV